MGSTDDNSCISLSNLENSGESVEPAMRELMEKSVESKQFSYSPYSNFRVGCAIICDDDTIFTGCNVENASYGLSICAERVAITKAVSEGHRKFKAISIAADVKKSFVGPCGACRQFLAEFGIMLDVYMIRPDSVWKLVKVKDLLPLSFGPSSLEEERIFG